ncbi:MAG: LytTR family transcriptional regulator [Bacteroidales bacterium]|jgi:DNA-binding LytR/AlgR family response regulator|nr:LytTR family transcriptional regulator [Bacteroidales bacterium]
MKSITAVFFIKNNSILKKLEDLFNHFSTIIILEKFSDEVSCMEKLESLRPDIFLIELESLKMDLSDFVNLIYKPPFIIGVGKNNVDIINYIDRGLFDFLVVERLELDYFCKKISKIKHIIKCLNLNDSQIFMDSRIENYNKKSLPDHIFIKNKDSSIKINYNDILYLKSNGNLTDVYLTSGEIITHKSNIKQFFDQLPTTLFARINNSTVINCSKVSKYQKDTVCIQQEIFNISRVYKNNFLKKLAIK